jgi:membrane protein YqaA with SNARE-associated domain
VKSRCWGVDLDFELLMLLLVWSIAEMAIVPAPMELFVIPLTASQNVNPLIVATVGTGGSVIGGMIDYYLGQRGFGLLNARFGITMRVKAIEKRFHWVAKYGFPGLLAIGRAFPLGSLKPVMILAGCVNYDKRMYIVIIALSSFVRYLVAATVGSLLAFLFAYL